MEINLSNKGLEGVLDIEQYCIDNNIDAKKVKGFVCCSNQITELKGLDKLVNLKTLYCRNNELTELDTSKLVNLVGLHCRNNKLTELDTSKLVNLQGLDCMYNKLTEIKGLDKLVNLFWLRCSSNKLTELDLSKLVNLEWLNGDEYIQPEQNKLDLLTNRVEKLEQIILEITKGK